VRSVHAGGDADAVAAGGGGGGGRTPSWRGVAVTRAGGKEAGAVARRRTHGGRQVAVSTCTESDGRWCGCGVAGEVWWQRRPARPVARGGGRSTGLDSTPPPPASSPVWRRGSAQASGKDPTAHPCIGRRGHPDGRAAGMDDGGEGLWTRGGRGRGGGPRARAARNWCATGGRRARDAPVAWETPDLASHVRPVGHMWCRPGPAPSAGRAPAKVSVDALEDVTPLAVRGGPASSEKRRPEREPGRESCSRTSWTGADSVHPSIRERETEREEFPFRKIRARLWLPPRHEQTKHEVLFRPCLCLAVDFLRGCRMWGGRWRPFVRGWGGGCLEHLVLLGWLAVDMRV